MYGIPIMIWIGPTFTDGTDALAWLRQTPDSVSGMLADDQEVHTHTTPIHSIRRQMMIYSGRLLMHLCGCTKTIVHFSVLLGRSKFKHFQRFQNAVHF